MKKETIMLGKGIVVATMVSLLLLSGCASVPMASKEADSSLKQFVTPNESKAGLYVYRNSLVGQALKKSISLDGVVIGETANKVYFYKEITPGNHTLATESEFSDNSIDFKADGGKNYFARQYIKIGVFVGGAGIEMVDEEVGKKEVSECGLAQQ
jgi:protein involved in sex pheromone biosynthesis